MEGYTATVGTTFRRSRVFLVGELSKFPLPYDSCRGEWFAYFVRGAPALCGQGTPEPPGPRRKNGFRRVTYRSTVRADAWELVTQAPTSKHVPPPPAPVAAAADCCRPPSESSQVGPTLRLLPTEQIKWPRTDTLSSGSAKTARSQQWEKVLGPGGSGASRLLVPDAP